MRVFVCYTLQCYIEEHQRQHNYHRDTDSNCSFTNCIDELEWNTVLYCGAEPAAAHNYHRERDLDIVIVVKHNSAVWESSSGSAQLSKIEILQRFKLHSYIAV